MATVTEVDSLEASRLIRQYLLRVHVSSVLVTLPALFMNELSKLLRKAAECHAQRERESWPVCNVISPAIGQRLWRAETQRHWASF